MSGLDKLLKHEKRLPYTFIGTIFGLLGIVIAIYFSVFYEKSPKLDLEIVSQFSALDIKESVKNLDVIYNDNSLNAQGLSLSVIELKIINSGSSPILKSYYDHQSQAGFKIEKGIIPENPIIIDAKTSYKTNEIVLNKSSKTTVLLPDIILNPLDFYTIKIIVLHASTEKPTISSFGVIAGIPKIRVLPNLTIEDKRNILERFFDGSIMMNISRLIILGFTFVFFTIFIVVSLERISEKRKKNRKLALINQFKKCNSYRLNSVPISLLSNIEQADSYTLKKLYTEAYEIRKNKKSFNSRHLEDFEKIGIIQISEIGRTIVDNNSLDIFLDLIHLFIEENLVENPSEIIRFNEIEAKNSSIEEENSQQDIS